MLKRGRAWARTCVRPASPCFAMVMLKNGLPNGSRPPPNVLCFVSSLVGVQVRQRRCIRNIFVPQKHHRKSRKYHGNATENHGKSPKITEGFFKANHGNSRSPAIPPRGGGGGRGTFWVGMHWCIGRGGAPPPPPLQGAQPLPRLTAGARLTGISLWDGGEPANTERFQGSVPLLPDLCSLSVP